MKFVSHETFQVDPKDVQIFVSRDRDQEKFKRMVQSIKEMGQQEPIEIVSLEDRPKEKKVRPEGGHYKWGLVAGQGRLTACAKLGIKCWAVEKKGTDAERVGRFLSENLNRDALPWHDKARLVVEELKRGTSVKQAAKKFHVTTGHVYKFQRIIRHTPKDMEKEMAAVPMNVAETLASQPEHVQRIVLQVADEEGLKKQLKTVLAKARAITESGEDLSPAALKASLTRVDEELKRTRETLKLKRLHHSLGPQNLLELLQDPKFKKALDSAGVNYTKFEKLTNR